MYPHNSSGVICILLTNKFVQRARNKTQLIVFRTNHDFLPSAVGIAVINGVSWKVDNTLSVCKKLTSILTVRP